MKSQNGFQRGRRKEEKTPDKSGNYNGNKCSCPIYEIAEEVGLFIFI